MVAQQTLTLFVWVQILVPLPKMGPGPEVAQALFFMKKPPRKRRHIFEVWLSLVERYVRDVEAAGSNPVTSTMFTHLKRCHTEKAPEFRGFLAFKRPKKDRHGVTCFGGCHPDFWDLNLRG